MKRAKVTGIAPQLIVSDVATTVAYYCEVLGFTHIGSVLEPPVYGMVERDGFQIHFGKSDHDHHQTNRNFRRINTDFLLWVPEINLFFEELQTKNAQIIEEITLRAYGNREFVFEDCNGYRITVCD